MPLCILDAGRLFLSLDCSFLPFFFHRFALSGKCAAPELFLTICCFSKSFRRNQPLPLSLMHRCYLENADLTQSHLIIQAEEAQHCLKVMRMRIGQSCEVFDGLGNAAECTLLASEGSRWMEMSIDKIRPSLPPLARISLALSIPKGGNMELIVQKAVELGVSRIIPLLTERCIVRLQAGSKEARSKEQKWQRIILEACKQCGVNELPKLEPIASFKDFIQREDLPRCRVSCALVAHARAMRDVLEEAREQGIEDILIIIGPEGDLSPAEYAQLEAKAFAPMSLGPIILRVETAVFMAIANARYALS